MGGTEERSVLLRGVEERCPGTGGEGSGVGEAEGKFARSSLTEQAPKEAGVPARRPSRCWSIGRCMRMQIWEILTPGSVSTQFAKLQAFYLPRTGSSEGKSRSYGKGSWPPIYWVPDTAFDAEYALYVSSFLLEMRKLRFGN